MPYWDRSSKPMMVDMRKFEKVFLQGQVPSSFKNTTGEMDPLGIAHDQRVVPPVVTEKALRRLSNSPALRKKASAGGGGALAKKVPQSPKVDLRLAWPEGEPQVQAERTAWPKIPH